MTSLTETIGRLRSHLETMPPTPTASITSATPIGAPAIAQGDVILQRVAYPKNTFNSVPLATGTRLVPDDTDGGRHFVRHVKGSPRMMPAVDPSPESLDGPILLLASGEECTIAHDGSGKHGDVPIRAIDEPMAIAVTYPRIYDSELRAERRVRD